MPQLDIFTYSSQIFWFTVVFWGLYIVLFTTFIFPFAFILKIRAYLSVLAIGPTTTNNSKFSFDSSSADSVSALFHKVSDLGNSLSASHEITLNSYSSLAATSFDSLHTSTDFAAFGTYVSVSKMSK
jgi:hypothetical protein